MMADSEEFYKDKDLSALYSSVRAKLPEEILTKILNSLSEKFDLAECVAVDVGCGPGQSAIPVAAHLKHITGVDVSEDQVTEGNRKNTYANIIYKVGTAEKLPIPDSSVHLVLTSNAAHWFDMPAFLKEADRVLVPNGVLAISSGIMHWASDDGCGDIKIPEVIELTDDRNNSYWSVIKEAKTTYENLKLPYGSAARKEDILVPEKITLAALMDRMKSIAGVWQFMKAKPEQAQIRIQDFQDRFLKFLGSKSTPEETEFTLIWSYVLCLTRKPL